MNITLPTHMPPRFLIVDSSMKDYLILRKALVSCGPADTWVDLADCAAEALGVVEPGAHEAIIIRDSLPDQSGEWLLSRLKMKVASHSAIQPFFFLLYEEGDGEELAGEVLRKFPDVTLVAVPYEEEDFARIAHEIVRPRSGQLRFYNLQLLDLMQAYMVSGRSATIRVLPRKSEQPMGMICIRGGKLVHAVHGKVSGLDALSSVATIKEGRIRLETGCTTARQTIRLHPMDALAEATRLMAPYRDLSFLDSMKLNKESGDETATQVAKASSSIVPAKTPPRIAPLKKRASRRRRTPGLNQEGTVSPEDSTGPSEAETLAVPR